MWSGPLLPGQDFHSFGKKLSKESCSALVIRPLLPIPSELLDRQLETHQRLTGVVHPHEDPRSSNSSPHPEMSSESQLKSSELGVRKMAEVRWRCLCRVRRLGREESFCPSVKACSGSCLPQRKAFSHIQQSNEKFLLVTLLSLSPETLLRWGSSLYRTSEDAMEHGRSAALFSLLSSPESQFPVPPPTHLSSFRQQQRQPLILQTVGSQHSCPQVRQSCPRRA